MVHIPVLKNEVIKYLKPKPNQNFIDATIDGGEHAKEILKRIRPTGQLLGIDLNKDILSLAKKNLSSFKKQLILVEGNFSDLKNIVNSYNFSNVFGILFDLGLSTFYLEESNLGFSFKKENEDLDMRFSKNQNLTAEQILNQFPEFEIYKIFKKFGEEKYSKQIAKKIILQRRLKKIKKVKDLNKIIQTAVPKKFLSVKIFARIFQALRIKVNNELENLEKGLFSAYHILNKKGKIVCISYHSLEDRIIKNFFLNFQKNGKLKILTKKVIRPSLKEIKQNPKSRSAKLRAAIKIN